MATAFEHFLGHALPAPPAPHPPSLLPLKATTWPLAIRLETSYFHPYSLSTSASLLQQRRHHPNRTLSPLPRFRGPLPRRFPNTASPRRACVADYKKRQLNDALPPCLPPRETHGAAQFFFTYLFLPGLPGSPPSRAAPLLQGRPQPSSPPPPKRAKHRRQLNRITKSPVVAEPAGFPREAVSWGRRSRSSRGRGWARGSG